MVGIVSYGAHIPYYRLSRDEIAKAMGRPSMGGEKAVASHDEDSITMAVSAARECIKGIDKEKIDALFFASTTPPYREKQCASVIAMAVDLRADVSVADFANSLRAGTNALRAAIDAVNSKSARLVLVTAADCRLGNPGSEFEQIFGAGAAALLIGSQDAVAEIEGSYTHSDEFMDQWRMEEDSFVRSWETRFVRQEGYTRIIQEGVSQLMNKYGLKPGDFTKVALYGPDPRGHRDLVRLLTFDPKTQVQDPLFDGVGNTGCAFAPMILVAALEASKPGDRILLASYGDGCDVFSFKVSDAIKKIKDRRAINHFLAHKAMLPNYGAYQRIRHLITSEVTPHPKDDMFVPVLWRSRAEILSLHGSKCCNCGELQFPKQRVCAYCGSKDNFEDVGFSDKKGSVFTYTIDNMAPSVNPPTVRCVVDFEGGGRMVCVMADCEPEKVAIDMTVEMIFRKLLDVENAGLHSYFWKCKPST
ncbi:hydroxymethylglutaryl-CoA synthase [Chloroflexota bacterium]